MITTAEENKKRKAEESRKRKADRDAKRSEDDAYDKLEREALLPPKISPPIPEAHVVACEALAHCMRQLGSCKDHSSQWKVTFEQVGATGRMRYKAECDKCTRTEVCNCFACNPDVSVSLILILTLAQTLIILGKPSPHFRETLGV